MPVCVRMITVAGILTALLSSGCASVFSKKQYAVTVENTPAPTHFSVYDRKNRVIAQGITPQQVTLDAKSKPFIPAKYSVVFAGNESNTRQKSLNAGVDPWTAGNLLLGGIPGLAVDGYTGAMYKLPDRVYGDVPAQYAVSDSSLGAQIASATVAENSKTSVR